jgi:peptidoglycan/LPS O-acetylase OafA/YrhL
MTQPYRTEIDGLRALAVLPVILFHANLGIASGGFIGVDIFFVISGYLITRIILGELHEGAFSVKRFYERRVRRILPALLTILAITSGVMMMIMLPTEFRQFAGSLLSATFFASNVYFQRTSGYFDPAAEEQPLLHTWSLAVEEQFYIFFPLALILDCTWSCGKFWLKPLGARWSFYR